MLVLVKELTVSAAMPKSHSLTSPDLLIRMLDGFTSVAMLWRRRRRERRGRRRRLKQSDTVQWVAIPRCNTLRLAFRKCRAFTVCREQSKNVRKRRKGELGR